MHYLKWYSKLQFVILKNRLWRDRSTIMRALSVMAAVIAAQIILTNILVRHVFVQVDHLEQLLAVSLFVVLIWLYLSTIAQSISSFIRLFYHAPDLNYLMALPIPINYLVIFKFFEHLITSTKSLLFLFFPLLTALGLTVNAPFIYYWAIIPLYVISVIIPCAVGILVAMIGLRFVSAKVFTSVTPLFIFCINVGFALLISRIQQLDPRYLLNVIEFFEKPLVTDIIPVTAATKLFYAFVTGEPTLSTFVALLFVSLIAIWTVFYSAKKLFFAGWVKHQHMDANPKKRQKRKERSGKANHHNEIIAWMKMEWLMALRNNEMFIGSAFMLFFYLFTLVIFIYSGLFSDTPILGVILLIMLAAIVNIIAVSVLFIPATITKDKSLWKSRYWLLKVLPIAGEKVFIIQSQMFFIPALIISIVGNVSYSIVTGLSLPFTLLFVFVLFFVLYGSSALYTAVELLSLVDFFNERTLLGNLTTIVLPVLYGVLSVGSVALYLAKDFVVEMPILAQLSTVLSLPIVIILSVATVLITCTISKLVFTWVWAKLAI
ncbi:Putative ATP-binding cassette [Amphibacillus marinus]|uniref:Putative ATP-binding cassette n=1 Tax=Amphibacillus marinus TaxID=872970 RepID=A0A1H8H3S8_9BACI|nr:hypothetical protein [Amphibacillus marinus]SEN50138.1 Putative ATP-binding cassette [Amphibacillus marinus]